MKLVVTQLLTTNIAIDQMDCLVVDNLSIPWGKNYHVICVFPPWVLTIISIKCIKLWMIVPCQYCSNCLICAMKYIMHNCRVQYLAFLAPKLHNTHVVLTKARMPRNLLFFKRTQWPRWQVCRPWWQFWTVRAQDAPQNLLPAKKIFIMSDTSSWKHLQGYICTGNSWAKIWRKGI